MTDKVHQDQAVENLQQFGLREYEAKCFVSLTKIREGTAREVSKHIDIPRTRVYEAVRSLESAGLVEIQHSSPQQFRAVPIPEALDILDKRHRTRMSSIEQSLRELRQSTPSQEDDDRPEIWSMSGSQAITTRVERLIGDAETEVLLLVGNGTVLSDGLYDELSTASERGVDVVVGTGSAQLRERLSTELREQMVYSTDLEWLGTGTETQIIGRLLFVDDEYLLASSIDQGEQAVGEQAVCGSGNRNGVVLALQRLLDSQLPSAPES